MKTKAPQWAKRVPKWKIARLYEDDARGMHDKHLIDEVAYALYARCKSMLAVEKARLGQAECPNCGGPVPHKAVRGAALVCGACSWSGAWDDYRASYQKKNLIAPGLQHFCREYIKQLPAAGSARRRFYWIDWLIHRLHWEGTALPGQPGATCLIRGRAQEVHAFLDNLSAGTHRAAEPGDLRGLWREEELERLENWRKRAEKRRAGR
jgi:hypothetical protein